MCTAATYMTDDFYFGRNLDYEFTYGESVTVVPRSFKFGGAVEDHGFALIGTAHIRDGYPLFYDAANERGVCMAGLNFVGNAVYYAKRDDKKNAAQYELIPFILRQCATAAEARQILNDINITDTPFAPEMPAAQLHWLVADRTDCFVLECMEDGMHIYDNPTGVLTNNPPFLMQMFALNDYMSLSSRQPGNNFCSGLPLVTYSRGMGAIGLPGDLSSRSRFVRTAFVRANSVSGDGERASVAQFFHILGAAEQQRGCCEVEPDKYEITVFSNCVNADKGIYYYTTYENSRVNAVDMHRENLDGETIAAYPMRGEADIFRQN